MLYFDFYSECGSIMHRIGNSSFGLVGENVETTKRISELRSWSRRGYASGKLSKKLNFNVFIVIRRDSFQCAASDSTVLAMLAARNNLILNESTGEFDASKMSKLVAYTSEEVRQNLHNENRQHRTCAARASKRVATLSIL